MYKWNRYYILFLMLSFSLAHADWQDVKNRITPLSNEKNLVLILPTLLCEKENVEGLDETVVEQIRSAFREKQYGSLESILESIDHPQALVALGILNFGSEKGTRYLQAAADNHQSFEALFNLGIQACTQQSTRDAITYFEKATEFDYCGLSFQYLGMIWQDHAVRTNSETSKKKCLEYLDIAANTYNAPEALALVGHLSQAEAEDKNNIAWQKLLDGENLYGDYKPYGGLLHQIGVNHLANNKKALACAYLHKAADTYNNNAARFALGVSYLSEKKYDIACSYLEKCHWHGSQQQEKLSMALLIAYVGTKNLEKAQVYGDYLAEHSIKI